VADVVARHSEGAETFFSLPTVSLGFDQRTRWVRALLDQSPCPPGRIGGRTSKII
jgi:hypothetical protein